MKKFFSLLLATGLMLSMAACGAKADKDAIVIGGLAPLTGSAAQYGVASDNGAKLAVKEINEAGGILGKQVTYISYDEKGDPTEAINAYNKLVQSDKIVALVGDVTTKPTIAVAQKAAQDNMPMITPTGTGAAITQAGSNIFRACFTDPYQGELMAHYSNEKLGAKTAAILFDTGNDYSVGIAETFNATATELGMEVKANEGYQTGAVDFNAQLTKIKDANVDVVMVPCYYEDATKIIIQAKNLGIEATFLGSDGWDGVLDQMDESNYESLDGAIFCSQYSMKDPDENLKKFVDAYKADNPKAQEPTMFAALGYEAMYLMAAAIENAGSTDSDKIVEAMKALNYDGMAGSIDFKGGQDPAREAYMIQFEGGAEKTLGTYSF